MGNNYPGLLTKWVPDRGLFTVQPGFLFQKLFLGLLVTGIRDTAVNRTNGSTLGFIVESFTFGTLVWYDIVEFFRYGFIFGVCVYFHSRCGHGNRSAQFCVLGIGPLFSGFINGVVRTFCNAGITIDAFVSDNDGHGTFNLSVEV
jgi:hypothetical protein